MGGGGLEVCVTYSVFLCVRKHLRCFAVEWLDITASSRPVDDALR